MHNIFSRRHFAAALPLVITAAGVLAQSIPVLPDAGALRQQIERDQGPLLPREATPPKPATPPPIAPSNAPSIHVKTFRFAGNTLLSASELEPVVAAYVGRTLPFAELQAAAAAIAQKYRESGWIVRAYLPQQEISEGIVTIQIVEAVFGGAQFEGPEPLRVLPNKVLSLFDAHQTTGAPLNAEALDRALLLADDLPGVSVAGALKEGTQSGQTDLVLKATDERLLISEAGIDNSGARTTGNYRATLTANLNSPFGLGDLLTTQFIHSQGSDYLRFGYTLPVASDGLRVGINASNLNYRIITPEFERLDPNGSSTSVGLEAGYPVIRSRQRNLYLLASLDHKKFDNESNRVVQSNYHVNTFALGLAGNLFDSLGGGGANTASLGFISGRVDQGTADANENPALAGHIGKWRAAISRQQVVTSRISLFASVAGQYVNKDIDSSEKFFLGGSSGVRAYPSNEGSGSSGQLATLELRTRIMDGLNLAAFYDWGAVRNYDGTPSYHLEGAGLSLTWMPLWGGSLRATYARRIGENPNPTANGRDQDGSLELNRWWLMATVPF